MSDNRGNLTWTLASLLLVLSTALAVRHRADIARALGADARAASAQHAPAAAGTTAAASAEPLRVLFIGNSLTSTQGMTGMVARLAAASKQRHRFDSQIDAPGGFMLSQHAAAGRLQGLLQRTHWDTVVLQEQGQLPGYDAESRERGFNPGARALDRMVRAGGAKTLFYLTYARRDGDPENYAGDDYDAMQGRITEGYTQIARELNAAVVPVGVIWQRVYHERPALQLWLPDRLHPSTAGAYLTACAFYAHFYRESPIGNPYLAGLDESDARAIQHSVAEVMLGWQPPAESRAMASDPPLRPDANARAVINDSDSTPVGNAAASAEAAQDRARHAQIEADRNARALRAARSSVPIKLYSASWCGYCKQAKAYMRDAQIAFDEYDIDRDSGAKAAVQRLNPRGSVPTIDLDGQVLVGWNAASFESTLDRAARARAKL